MWHTVQIIGYGARCVSHFNKTSTIAYAMQSLFLLLAPILYAASIYMVLGRVIKFVRGEKLSYIPVEIMTKVFVGGDVFSFLLQAAGKRQNYHLSSLLYSSNTFFIGGGIMTGGSANTLVIGQWVIVAGLCVQLVFFGAFLVSAFIFHSKISRHPTTKSEQTIHPGSFWPRDWRGVLFGCYVVSILILIRSVYRLVEFIQGQQGYLMSHEVFLYVFDATMMLFVMVLMNFCHPAHVLQQQVPSTSPERKA